MVKGRKMAESSDNKMDKVPIAVSFGINLISTTKERSGNIFIKYHKRKKWKYEILHELSQDLSKLKEGKRDLDLKLVQALNMYPSSKLLKEWKKSYEEVCIMYDIPFVVRDSSLMEIRTEIEKEKKNEIEKEKEMEKGKQKGKQKEIDNVKTVVEGIPEETHRRKRLYLGCLKNQCLESVQDKGKRIQEVTDELETPLIQWEVNDFSKPTEIESKVASWIFSFEGDKSDVVFETNDGFQSTRFMMESLIPESEAFYNPGEIFKENSDQERNNALFWNNFVEFLERNGQIQDLKKFDLEGKTQVIDNSVVDVSFSAKYGSIPIALRKVFVNVLKQLDDERVKKLNRGKPKREKMSWRTLRNQVDCAVFMMIHMETYMGQDVKDWDCGLANEGSTQKSQLLNLQHKYVGRMLLSDLNIKKNLVIEGMGKFAEYPMPKQKEILEYAKTMIYNRLIVMFAVVWEAKLAVYEAVCAFSLWLSARHKLFVEALKIIKDERANKLLKAKQKIQKMSWRTSNQVDCGIFAMRHMETFMGGNLLKWHCGFDQEGDKQKLQIEYLRIKYVSEILLSNVNCNKEFVTAERSRKELVDSTQLKNRMKKRNVEKEKKIAETAEAIPSSSKIKNTSIEKGKEGDKRKKMKQKRSYKIEAKSILLRTSPKNLITANRSLSPVQKKWIEDIGLGSILNLDIDTIPSKLAYGIVQAFDNVQMVIKTTFGDIRVTNESVSEMLGLKNEGLDIKDFISDGEWNDELTSWREQYCYSTIRQSEVQKKISESEADDWNFRLNFIILFVNSMANTLKMGTVDTTILSFLPKKDDLKKINWCKYICDSAKNTKYIWNSEVDGSFFTGPITFLMLHHVDSTLCKAVPHRRVIPAIKEWNTKMVFQRQIHEFKNGGFGNLELNYEIAEVLADNVFFVKKEEEIVYELDKDFNDICGRKKILECKMFDYLKLYPDSKILNDWKKKFEGIFRLEDVPIDVEKTEKESEGKEKEVEEEQSLNREDSDFQIIDESEQINDQCYAEYLSFENNILLEKHMDLEK
ncbi:hypothetical protein OSB04_021600 [Centaurea solstitialis]|uniref:Ubiquitin-like protease family profile domain-containing protein n=1 Tax=Centaurea solstitialis TaxID=347529 RepID=A0AA38TCW1_9ASTR|nr:hypothetical protein OSB04_021600 [Centaurea solstitialis]